MKLRPVDSLQTPFLHFLAGGFVVYVAATTLAPSTDLLEAASITLAEQSEMLSAEDQLVIEALRRGFHDDIVVRTRIEANRVFVGDSDLSGDALASMTWRDPVVRRRLLQRAQFASAHEIAPSAADRALGQRGEGTAPGKASVVVRFDERFFAAQGSAAKAREDAFRTLEGLLAGTDTRAHTPPINFEARTTLASVARYLGEEFATALGEAPLHTWSGPIRSTQGWHVVRIHERRAP